MDLFHLLPDFQVLVCKQCAFGVRPAHLKNHIARRHRCHSLETRSAAGVSAIVDGLLSQRPCRLVDPACEPITPPRPDSDALPFLKLENGFGCTHCAKVLLHQHNMERHYGRAHAPSRRKGGRPSLASKVNAADKGPHWRPIACQRFFIQGHQSSYFRVVSPTQREEERETQARQRQARCMPRNDYISSQVYEDLEAVEREQEAAGRLVVEASDRSEISPWLELTRWPRYLKAHPLSEIAPLAYPPDAATEPVLVELAASLDRLVETSFVSVCEDKINVFDQKRINTFLTYRRAYDRPLMVKLQKSTYRQYKGLWKRLLCFVFRSSQPENAVELSHRLTPLQTASLDSALAAARLLLVSRARQTGAEAGEGNAPVLEGESRLVSWLQAKAQVT